MKRLLRDLAMLEGPEHRCVSSGWMLLDGGVIAAMGQGDPPEAVHTGAAIMDCRHRLAASDLVNAHRHSQSSTLAGFGDRLSHPAFMWRTLALTVNRTPAEIALAVQLTAWWAFRTGTAALLDHFPGHRFTPLEVEAVLAAWHGTGLRAVVGLRFFDQGFTDILPEGMAADADQGLLQPQPLQGLAEIMEVAITSWHGQSGAARFARRALGALVLCAWRASMARRDRACGVQRRDCRAQHPEQCTAQRWHSRYSGVARRGRAARLGHGWRGIE